MKIDIRFEIPSVLARFARIVIAPGILLGTAALAYAAVPNTFKNGDALDAAPLNANFVALDTRVDGIEKGAVAGSSSISPSAVYTGLTDPLVGAAIGGYRGAKLKCEVKFGTAAHMCSTEEMIRSMQLGLTVPVPTEGAFRIAGNFSTHSEAGTLTVLCDCLAYTASTSGQAGVTYVGNAWGGGGVPAPGVAACDVAYPIGCCK